MKIRMEGKHINTTITQRYTPNNDSEEKSKDAICVQVQAEVESMARHEIQIVIGDLNGKIGNHNTIYGTAMGEEWCARMNIKERDDWSDG